MKVGDKVKILKSDYEAPKRLNGLIGIIAGHSFNKGFLEVLVPEEKAPFWYTKDELQLVEPGYDNPKLIQPPNDLLCRCDIVILLQRGCQCNGK